MASNVGLKTAPGSGAGLRFGSSGLIEMAHALQVIPEKIRKNALQASRSNIGTVSRRAAENFYSDIRRPKESGQGQERGRQTGNFTFGKDNGGGAFQGGSFAVGKDQFGFGFPNIDIADAKTKYVWRSLEYGLPGTEHGSSALVTGRSRPFPEESHQLPRRFWFSTGSPKTSVLGVPKKGVKSDRWYKGGPENPGKGFEGKHFIDEAWIVSLETFKGRYKRLVTEPFAVFK